MFVLGGVAVTSWSRTLSRDYPAGAKFVCLFVFGRDWFELVGSLAAGLSPAISHPRLHIHATRACLLPLQSFRIQRITSCVCGGSTTDEPASNFSPNNVSPTAGLPRAGRRGRGNSEIKKSWQIVQRRREDIEENRKCVKLWDLRGCPGRSRGRLSLLIGRAAMRNRVKTSSSHFGNFDLLSLL